MAGSQGLGSMAEGAVGIQLDFQQLQMNAGKIAAQPVELEKERTELMKDKLQLAQQMKLAQLMQNFRPEHSINTPMDMADTLNELAGIQASAGMPDAAAKSAGEASRILENSSKVEYRTFKIQNDRLSRFANVLDSVPDTPQGWAAAVQAMMGDPGAAKDPKFQNLARQPWKPGLLGMVKKSVVSAKDQAETRYRQAATSHAEASTRVDEARVDLIKQQTQVAKDRDVALRKVGGTIVKSDQLRAITDQVKTDFPSADDSDIRVRSRPLAEEMVKMMSAQHLTLSEASTRVYEDARSKGVFSGLRQASVIPGSKPGKAIPVTGKMKLSDLRQNQWYTSKERFGDDLPRLIMGTRGYTEEELATVDAEDKDLLDDSEDSENPEDEESAR